MEFVQSFIFYSILVGFLLQILGDMQLNRYLRFYGGLIFVLLLMSPLYELFTGEDVAWNIELKSLWTEYEQSKEWVDFLPEKDDFYLSQTVEMLVHNMNDFLQQSGYEIIEYDVVSGKEGEVETLKLYVVRLGEMGISAAMTDRTQNALKLQTLLVQNYEPEFALEVYCNE